MCFYFWSISQAFSNSDDAGAINHVLPGLKKMQSWVRLHIGARVKVTGEVLYQWTGSPPLRGCLPRFLETRLRG